MTTKVKILNILVIFGTRPEAIKLAPLILILRNNKNINLTVCITAQHRKMLDDVLNVFSINPEIDLDIMTNNQNLETITKIVLEKVSNVLDKIKPNLVLVHGDTTTAFVSALSAFYKKIKVGHVEAGLRTYDKYSPFPEELNRQFISKIADLHFAPTKESVSNLISEGINNNTISLTGNTVVDALELMKKKLDSDQSFLSATLYSFSSQIVDVITNKKFILMTGHRRENFGDSYTNILKAIKSVCKTNPDINVIFPVHLNPIVQKLVKKELSDLPSIYLLEPLNYPQFILLLKKCFFVITDSGGIQEEAPSFGKVVLVTRTVTERNEAMKSGRSILVGTNYNKIVSSCNNIINTKQEKLEFKPNPFGDGSASYKIEEKIMENIKKLLES